MASEATYDVFLSHSTPDKPAVERLALRLKTEGLKPFLDKWHIVPGEPWQEAIEKAMVRSRTCAVFVGPGPLGPWQKEELRNALDMRVRDDSRRVIPVLLPGASTHELPPLLTRLTWVDFRSGLDDSHALHRLVCGIRGIEPEAGPAGVEPLLPPHVRPTMIGVPHRNPFFTGRETLLTRLHQQVQAQGISALAQAAIYGLGGIGKTQTAIEYAYRFGQHYRFILWVASEEDSAIRADYLSIARELGLVNIQAGLELALLALKAWLSRESGWLLIFDNANDPALVRPYLPPTRTGGKILLTSRAKSFTKVGIKEPFRVETMEPEDAVKFLIERSRNVDAEAAAQLAAELGHLPLALEQAAAFIETVGGGFAEYLTKYRRQGVALFEKGEPGTDYPKTVATTWMLNFEAVRAASPASAELLSAAAFASPDFIPIEFFTEGRLLLGDVLARALKGANQDPLVFWELLEPLERYSLVERLPGDAFKLHRLTQAVVKESLGEEGRRAWAERVVRTLNAAYPPVEFEKWKLCERLQPTARHAFELTRTYKLEFAEAGRLFNEVGVFARANGDYASAIVFNKLSLEIYVRVLGSEHPYTFTSMNNLAAGYRGLGDLDGARKLQELTLEIRERVLGAEHPDTLTSRNDLASTFRALGDLARAKELQELNLEICERVLGGEHPDTLTTKNNLAGTLADIGDLAGAKKLQEQTLVIQERVLGAEHPNTLYSRNNLAATLRALGDLVGARKLLELTLESRERVLGTKHPDTTVSTWNLLRTVQQLNDPDAEAKLIDKLRWLLHRDEDSIQSATQRKIRQALLNLLNPS